MPLSRPPSRAFAAAHGLSIAAFYVENGSGAKLARPELFRLLSDARPGDILLVEQVDRLSRLTASNWEKLKAELAVCCVRVVALDLPTSWMMAKANSDDFTARMFDAINGMMLDMLAAVARKDCEDRRRRQAQGQAEPGPKRSTRLVRETLLITAALQLCSEPVRPGRKFRLQSGVAGRLWRRSPSELTLGRAQFIRHSADETIGPSPLQMTNNQGSYIQVAILHPRLLVKFWNRVWSGTLPPLRKTRE